MAYGSKQYYDFIVIFALVFLLFRNVLLFSPGFLRRLFFVIEIRFWTKSQSNNNFRRPTTVTTECLSRTHNNMNLYLGINCRSWNISTVYLSKTPNLAESDILTLEPWMACIHQFNV